MDVRPAHPGHAGDDEALDFLADLRRSRVMPLECDYPLADTHVQGGSGRLHHQRPLVVGGLPARRASTSSWRPLPMVSATGLWPAPMTAAKCYSINRVPGPGDAECTAGPAGLADRARGADRTWPASWRCCPAT